MRSTLSPYPTLDVQRTATVKLWRGVTCGAVLDGATPLYDLSPFAVAIKTSNDKASIDIQHSTEFFDCAYQPRSGDVIGIQVDGQWRSITIVDTIDNFVEERGTRSFTITGRSRDGVGGWRVALFSSPIYPLGTGFYNICVDICSNLMRVDSNEYVIPAMSYAVPHTNIQFSGETPWSMLESVAFATKQVVFVNVLNQIAFYGKDILREADLSVSNDSIVRFSVGRRTSNLNGTVKLKWLDPQMKKQFQQMQVLASEALAAGFFKKTVKRTVWFSDDHTQRVDDSYMKIIESCNTGMIGVKVASEEYAQKTPYYGVIRLDSYWWVPTLFTVALAVLVSYSFIPDGVDGPTTTPIGRVVEATAQLAIFTIMVSIGTGEYEIWGTPYDYIHATNTTIVRACDMPYHSMSEQEMDSVLLQSEQHAQDTAVAELLLSNAKTYSIGVELVDDPRIEVGDVLLFENGTRMLVEGFSNDFSRGADATIDVEGYIL